MVNKSRNKPPPYTKLLRNVFVGRDAKKYVPEDGSICKCVRGDQPDIDPDASVDCGKHCINYELFYECHSSSCPCGERCRNQKFQRRETAPTKILETPGRGWGLFAAKHIPADTFVVEYMGEVINMAEASRRQELYKQENEAHFYMMNLHGQERIDATRKASFGRFINHSCEPNCYTRKVEVLGEMRVGIYTKEDVPASTELTYDYDMEWHGGEKVKCLCGKPSCVGYLGAKSRGFQMQEYLSLFGNCSWEKGTDGEYYAVEQIDTYDSSSSDEDQEEDDQQMDEDIPSPDTGRQRGGGGEEGGSRSNSTPNGTTQGATDFRSSADEDADQEMDEDTEPKAGREVTEAACEVEDEDEEESGCVTPGSEAVKQEGSEAGTRTRMDINSSSRRVSPLPLGGGRRLAVEEGREAWASRGRVVDGNSQPQSRQAGVRQLKPNPETEGCPRSGVAEVGLKSRRGHAAAVAAAAREQQHLHLRSCGDENVREKNPTAAVATNTTGQQQQQQHTKRKAGPQLQQRKEGTAAESLLHKCLTRHSGDWFEVHSWDLKTAFDEHFYIVYKTVSRGCNTISKSKRCNGVRVGVMQTKDLKIPVLGQ